MADTLRPYLGDRVLEIGAGIGTLTAQLIPRDLYVASDINPYYLQYLRSYAVGKPYLRVARLDAGAPEDFAGLRAFDTVLMVNVLEHVPDEPIALGNVHAALGSGPGRDPGAPTSGLVQLLGCCARAQGAVHRAELRAALERQGSVSNGSSTSTVLLCRHGTSTGKS